MPVAEVQVPGAEARERSAHILELLLCPRACGGDAGDGNECPAAGLGLVIILLHLPERPQSLGWLLRLDARRDEDPLQEQGLAVIQRREVMEHRRHRGLGLTET